MSLWDWTLEAYARPGVPEACLALQDEHDLNTSFLLWAVWAEGANAAVLAQAANAGKVWDSRVFVFTGVMAFGPRKDCQALVEERGG